MSFAQRLYASARVQQQSNNATQATNSRSLDSTSPPLVQRERTPVPFAHRDEKSHITRSDSDSSVHAKQSDRLVELQRQSLTPSHDSIPSSSGSVSGSTVPHYSHGPPPAFSSSSSPPPEPPEWEWQERALNDCTLERSPTLPIYSPVAEEGISYSIPDDEMDGLIDADAFSVAGNSEPRGSHVEIVSGGGHINNHDDPEQEDLPTESGSSHFHHQPVTSASASNGLQPTISPTALANAATRMTATERSPSVAAQNTVNNRRILGPRPGPRPAAPHASASAYPSSVDGIQGRQVSEQASSNAPRPSSNLSSSATPASRLSMNNPSPRSIAAPVSEQPTESGSAAAAYARSLYASAVANAAHPQRSSQVIINQYSHATNDTDSDPDVSIASHRKHLTATRTPSASGVAVTQSLSVIAPSPRPITLSAPQTQIQHLQAQAAATVAVASSTPASSTSSAAPSVLSPPPLPQRRSAASGLASTMRIERLSPEDSQSTVQSQTQGQVRPYRYSTAVVPASPVVSTHSSNSGSSTSFSLFGTPASSSSTSSSFSWVDKTKKKTGGLLGVSSQKHKEMKKKEEEERRARERAAAARAVAAAQQEASAGVVRRVPPPPPPVKPTASTESTQTFPANVHSNPYVAAAYAQQAQAQPQLAHVPLQSQTVQVQNVQTHPGMLQQPQPENATLMNILTGMNTSLTQANGRVQASVSAALRQAGTVAGNVVNATSNALDINGSVAQRTRSDFDLFGGTSDFTDVRSSVQQVNGLDVDAFSDGQGVFDPTSFAEELGAGLSSFTTETVDALDGFNNDSVLDDLPGEGLALNGLGQLDPSILDFSAFDASSDVSALTGAVQDGGFDMGSLSDALNFDADAQDTNLDGGTFGGEGVYMTDDTGFADEAYADGDDATATSDDFQFVGNEDPNAFDTGLEIDESYDFAGDVPSDTIDSSKLLEADGEAPVPEDLGSGLDDSNLYQDFLDIQNYQLDQFSRQEVFRIDQNDQDGQDGQYVYGFERRQEGQQDQVEAPQQTLENQQDLGQQQLHQQPARLEHRLQQQLNQQIRRSQAQAQALQQRLALERRKQQMRFARLQAQLQMQAKHQAEYLARVQQQQAELQQKLQNHFITQGASQPDVVAMFMEDLKKLQEEQTQAMMKLAQMHGNMGLGDATGAGTGSSTDGGGMPQVLQGGTTVGHGRPQNSSPGNARPLRPAAGMNQQQSAGGSGGHHVQAKPPANAGAPAARLQHSSPGGVRLHANTGNTTASTESQNHVKPVAVKPPPPPPAHASSSSSSSKPQVQDRPCAANGSASATPAAHDKISTGAAGGSGTVNHSHTLQSAHVNLVARPYVGAAGQKVQLSPNAMTSHPTGGGANHAHVQPSTVHVAPNTTADAAKPPVNSQLQHLTSVSRPTVANEVRVAPVPAPNQVQSQQAKLLRMQRLQTRIKRLHLRQAQLQQAQAQGQTVDQNQSRQLQMQIQTQIQQLQRLLQVELGQVQVTQQSGLSPPPPQVQPQLDQAHHFVQMQQNIQMNQIQQQQQVQQEQEQEQEQEQGQQQQQETGASFTAGAQQELGRLAVRAGVTIGRLVLLAANNNQ